MMIFFAVALILFLPGIVAGAKTKPKLATKKKITAVGQTCQLKLNRVSVGVNVKWETSKKRGIDC